MRGKALKECVLFGQGFHLTGQYSEVEAELRGVGARRNVVRPAECRKEVVQRVLVGHVDGRQPQTPLVAIAPKQVVLAERHVKQAAGRNARRIVVVVLRARLRNRQECGPILRSKAQARRADRSSWSRVHAAAE